MWIRSMNKWDYPAVDRLLLQLQRQDVANRPDRFAPLDHYMPRRTFENLLDNDNVAAFLAQEGGQVVGCCFVSLLEKSSDAPMRIAYIDLLVVDEHHRRQGIGKALFQTVQKRARKFGAKKVELMVWSHNADAIKAYEALGMAPQRSIYEISV